MIDTSNNKRDFFVSFNQADRAFATWIAWVLEEAGYQVWFQDWDFRGNFVEHMNRAHAQAHRTLAVLSDHYFGSDFTLAEWSARLAQDPAAREDRLVPAKVGPLTGETILGPILYADLTGCDEAAAQQRLIERVRKALDVTYRPKPLTRPTFPDSAPIREVPSKPEFPGAANRLLADFRRDADQEYFDTDKIVGLVQKLAEADVRHQAGTIKMLRFARPVPTPEIYVDLQVLSRPSKDLLSLSWTTQLRTTARDFDRFGLGSIERPRKPALEQLGQFRRALVIGKPGSGKSTLLKAIAISALSDNSPFVERAVPLFFEIRRIEEQVTSPERGRLADLIKGAFHKWKASQFADELLCKGRILLLLDGLDEVSRDKRAAIRDAIEEFEYMYSSNRIIVTSRPLSREVWFESFTDLEISDFDISQRATFINNWFSLVEDRKAERQLVRALESTLEQSPELSELAGTPILLNLLCSVTLDENGAIPSRRGQLYEVALRDMFEKWDYTRGVHRPTILASFSTGQKHQLLAHIALTLFVGDDLFPSRERLCNLIAEFYSVPKAVAEDILDEIQQNYGIIIERADGYFSFSHLTFQEFFAARALLTVPVERTVRILDGMRRYEVFRTLLEISPDSKEIFRQFRDLTNKLLTTDRRLRKILPFVRAQARGRPVPFKPVAVRAFYFSLISAAVFCQDKTTRGTLDLASLYALVIAPHIDPPVAMALSYANELRKCLGNGPVAEFTGISHALGASLSSTILLAMNLDEELKGVFEEGSRELPKLFEIEADTECAEILLRFRGKVNEGMVQTPEFLEWWSKYASLWQSHLFPIIQPYQEIWGKREASEYQRNRLLRFYYNMQMLVHAIPALARDARAECEDTLL